MLDHSESLYKIFFLLLFCFATVRMALAEENGYRQPPHAIMDLVDAPPTPLVSVSPVQTHLLIMSLPSFPSIAELAQPELRLAGLRINPKTFAPSRSSYFIKLALKKLPDGKESEITGLPDQVRIRNVQWSPDGQKIAFTTSQDDGLRLWVADVHTLQAKQISHRRIHAVQGLPFSWLADNNTLLVKLVPENREPAPAALTTPTGPIIQENLGKKTPAPTFQDLMKNGYDESLFEYYGQSEIALIDLQGATRPLLPTAFYRSVELSPDNRYFLVQTIHRPFSYLVPYYRFPYAVNIYNLEGQLIKTVADLPLAEEVPIGNDAVPTGPRNFMWRQDAPAVLCWTEAQDNGDPKQKAEIRDHVFCQTAPFSRQPELWVKLALRFDNIYWGRQDKALIYESWWMTRQTRVWLANPNNPGQKPRLLFDYSSEDRYHHPGHPMTQATPSGGRILRFTTDNTSIYLRGEGASPQGDLPFLDACGLAEGQTKRLWQCRAPYYEFVLDILQNGKSLLTRREAVAEQPNYFVTPVSGKKTTQLTFFPHPTPQLKQVKKELITYKRQDGVSLTATLYLPPDYSLDQGPLPMLMWAYPQEFKSAAAAGQVTDSPYRFVRISSGSPLFWLMRGYAILDDPALPIIGEGEQEPNDTYVQQLVAGAKAAVEEVVRRGVADRKRIAIGGHSYGAFMTANLLSHCDLFAAGIARSGAYNRTLTPFGFQAEERLLWDAPETYIRMSPFMTADKVRKPILLIHGEADNNTGTFPLQSERYYAALKGLGKTTRLVILPAESHGYQARESILHMLWEMDQWLEKYVK